MLVQEREVRGRDRNILVDDEYKHGAVDEWCKAPVSVTRLLEDRHVRLCRKATVAADVRKRRVRRVQLGNPRDKLQENCMSACLEMHVSWVKKGCGEGSDGGRRSKNDDGGNDRHKVRSIHESHTNSPSARPQWC